VVARTALGPHLVKDAESALTAAHRITTFNHVARSTIATPIFHAGSHQGRRLRRGSARVGKGRGGGHEPLAIALPLSSGTFEAE
jgi:hypothetical protein